jgi:hypothetical protein
METHMWRFFSYTPILLIKIVDFQKKAATQALFPPKHDFNKLSTIA